MSQSELKAMSVGHPSPLNKRVKVREGWGETTHTLVPWRQGCSHPIRNQCMGWFALLIFYQVKMLMFYNVQTINFTCVSKIRDIQ